MREYSITLENARETCDEMLPLYTQHYGEMRSRLHNDGVEIPAFKPRLESYFKAADAGYFLHYVVRIATGKAVGYCNMYLTNDMHNGDLIAKEDTVYIVPEHRNGIGRKLVLAVREDMRARGVKRIFIQPVTDLRVGKIWERLGFKPIAQVMVYDCEAA